MNDGDNDFIELHYFTKKFAIKQTMKKLFQIKNQIQDSDISPNHDEKIHIVQISCGVGKNSKDGPILNKAVKEMLEKAKYEYFPY